MNYNRRKKLGEAKLVLEKAKDIVSDVLDEEDEARDNMPESLQGSERYENSERCSDAMNEAIESIDSAIENLETAEN